MSGAKHTPGPWNVVNTRPSDALDIAVIFDAQSQVVCSIPKGSSNKPMLERRANARLISASPDLLAAAQLILRGYGVTFQDAALRGLLADAVAKALGEQQ
jgi:hypothetical protein